MTASLTLWCQDSTKVSYNDLKEILILASKGEKIDSIITAYDIKIELIESIIELKNDELLLSADLILAQKQFIDKLSNQLEISEKKVIRRGRIIVIGSIIIIVETLILLL